MPSDLDKIDLPDGNMVKGFYPVAIFDKKIHAASYAHALCREHKISVSWDVCKDNGKEIGYAVYVSENLGDARGVSYGRQHQSITPQASNDANFAMARIEIGGEG